MNSTAYANRVISPFRRFNSQRIELFHIPAGRYKCSGRSFNSQRDGIPQILGHASLDMTMFQFSTGWNSTIFTLSRHSAENVSIPNGMEFYIKELYRSKLKPVFQFPTGWNSTLRLNVFMSLYSLFQFPTGWNSTSPYV